MAPLYFGPDTTTPFSWGEERKLGYPSGLKLDIDGAEFETVGACIEELLPGIYEPRRWVAIRALTSTGSPLSRTRLVDEQGCAGLRQRAEQQRHRERM